LVLGTSVYFDSMNGYMSIFLERLWSLRHQKFPIEGKPFCVVATGDRLQGAENAVEAVKRRMVAYKAEFVGGVPFGSENFPCYSCGFGHRCTVGGLYRTYGRDGLRKLKTSDSLFTRWEDFSQITRQIEKLAENLNNTLGEE